MFLKLYVLLYADDSILIAESERALQEGLNALESYCKLNNIIVNTDQSKEKTKVMICSRGKPRTIPNFAYGNDPIEVVFQYTYLGIRFNYNGEFHVAIAKRIELARAAMFGLIRKINRLGLTLETQIELFERTVLPVALYGCEVWGASDLSQLEAFQTQFFKYVLKLARFTPSCMVLGETGRMNLKSIIRTRMLSYWSRLINGPQRKIASQVYYIARRYHENTEREFSSKWLDEIKNALADINRPELWDAPTHSNDLKSEHKRLRKTLYKNVWLENVQNDPRCSYYQCFKSELVEENYMKLTDIGNAITLDQLRTNNCRQLPTNRLRFVETAWDTSCPLCSMGENGDEIHYIFRCPFFTNTRPSFFRELSEQGTQNDIHNLSLLLQNDRLGHLTRLAKFTSQVERTLKNHYEKKLSAESPTVGGAVSSPGQPACELEQTLRGHQAGTAAITELV